MLDGLVSLPLSDYILPANITYSVTRTKHITLEKTLTVCANTIPELQIATLLSLKEVEDLAADIPHLWVAVKDSTDIAMKFAFVHFTIEEANGAVTKKTINTHLNGLVSLPLTGVEMPANIYYHVTRIKHITSQECVITVDEKIQTGLQIVTLHQEDEANNGAELFREAELAATVMPYLWVGVTDSNNVPLRFAFVHFTIQDTNGVVTKKTINTRLGGLVSLPLADVKMPAVISYHVTRINYVKSQESRIKVENGMLPELENITLLKKNEAKKALTKDIKLSAKLLSYLWVVVKNSEDIPINFAFVHFTIEGNNGIVTKKTINTNLRGLVSLPLVDVNMPANISFHVTRINHVSSEEYAITVDENQQPELQTVVLLNINEVQTEPLGEPAYLWVGVQDSTDEVPIQFASVHFIIQDANGLVTERTINTEQTGIVNLELFSFQMPASITYFVTCINHLHSENVTLQLLENTYPDFQNVKLQPYNKLQSNPTSEFRLETDQHSEQLVKYHSSSRDELSLWFSVTDQEKEHLSSAYIKTILEDDTGKSLSIIIKTGINGLASLNLAGMTLPIKITYKVEKYLMVPSVLKIITIDTYIPELQHIQLVDIGEDFAIMTSEPLLFIGVEGDQGEPIQFANIRLIINDSDQVVTETILNTQYTGMVSKSLKNISMPAKATFYYMKNNKQASAIKTIDLNENAMPSVQILTATETEEIVNKIEPNKHSEQVEKKQSSSRDEFSLWFSVTDQEQEHLRSAYVKTILEDATGKSSSRLIKTGINGLASLNLEGMTLPIKITYKVEKYLMVPSILKIITIDTYIPELQHIQLVDIGEDFATNTSEPLLFIGVEEDQGEPIQFANIRLIIEDSNKVITENILNTQYTGMVSKSLKDISMPAKATFYYIKNNKPVSANRTIDLNENAMPAVQILTATETKEHVNKMVSILPSSIDKLTLWFSVSNLEGEHLSQAIIDAVLVDVSGKRSPRLIRTGNNGLASLNLDSMSLPINVTYRAIKYGMVPSMLKSVVISTITPELETIELMNIGEDFALMSSEPTLFIGVEDSSTGRPIQFASVRLNIEDANGTLTQTDLNTKISGMVSKSLEDIIMPAKATFFYVGRSGKQASDSKTIDLKKNSMPALQILRVN